MNLAPIDAPVVAGAGGSLEDEDWEQPAVLRAADKGGAVPRMRPVEAEHDSFPFHELALACPMSPDGRVDGGELS